MVRHHWTVIVPSSKACQLGTAQESRDPLHSAGLFSSLPSPRNWGNRVAPLSEARAQLPTTQACQQWLGASSRLWAAKHTPTRGWPSRRSVQVAPLATPEACGESYPYLVLPSARASRLGGGAPRSLLRTVPQLVSPRLQSRVQAPSSEHTEESHQAPPPPRPLPHGRPSAQG